MKHWIGRGLAVISVLIWGSTFIVTRLLLDVGLGPDEIMIYRFVIAYLILWIIHPHFKRPESFLQEFMFFLAGACGVTLYFLAENQALAYTTVSNTSLLVTTAPLFTGLLTAIIWRQKLNVAFFIGFVAAISGIALILFSDGIPKIYPKGDLLALTAAFLWAIYSIAIKQADNERTHILIITRRVFFYGILLFVPMMFILKTEYHFTVLVAPGHLLALLFLSVIASALCYVIWNKSTLILGPVKANLFIYLIPVTSLLTARIFLKEELTALGWLGAVLVICGLVISNLQFSFSSLKKMLINKSE